MTFDRGDFIFLYKIPVSTIDSPRTVFTFLQLVKLVRCCTRILDFHSKNIQITSKLLTQGCRYHKLRKTFGKFFRSYSELLSKFSEISFQDYVSEGIPHPVFYSDLVYKLRSVKGSINFVLSGLKIVKRLRRRKYVWPNDHREDNMVCAWPFYSVLHIFPKTLYSY